MPRPLFQASAVELEGLFERHKDDAEQLAVLLAELEHRSTARAIALKGRIRRLLAVRKARAAAAVAATADPSGSDAEPGLPFAGPTPHSQDRSAREPRPNDTARAPVKNRGSAPKLETARIRKQGRLRDVPDARPRFTSNKLDLKLSPDAPILQRYIKSLDVLVSDMRRKNSGMRTLTVTDGRR